MKGISGRIGDIRDFLVVGIWKAHLDELKGGMRLIISGLRVLSITMRKYLEDQCSLRSSALTFFTLMSIVPIAAVAFAIAKGFGFQKLLEQQLMEQFSGHEDIVAQVMEF
jgi:membrane protein